LITVFIQTVGFIQFCRVLMMVYGIQKRLLVDSGHPLVYSWITGFWSL